MAAAAWSPAFALAFWSVVAVVVIVALYVGCRMHEGGRR